eukprot:1191317-Prorocentrum_minimum.AAC.5
MSAKADSDAAESSHASIHTRALLNSNAVVFTSTTEVSTERMVSSLVAVRTPFSFKKAFIFTWGPPTCARVSPPQ